MKDGDSFNITFDKVRLADVDAPEWNDSGLAAAKSALEARAESYYKIINEPDLITIDFLLNEDADKLESEQAIEQIKKSVMVDFLCA